MYSPPPLHVIDLAWDDQTRRVTVCRVPIAGDELLADGCRWLARRVCLRANPGRQEAVATVTVRRILDAVPLCAVQSAALDGA